jgi:hypothetical protein
MKGWKQLLWWFVPSPLGRGHCYGRRARRYHGSFTVLFRKEYARDGGQIVVCIVVLVLEKT